MNKRFMRTAKYDSKWVEENKMGPNPLWLLEELCRHMKLEAGMKVLDMGCGRAITSIFLAKEFGVQVWANDLWIDPTDNLNRIIEAGVDNLVYPIRAEAHALPYAEGFFDAAISIDAYHYFGTDETYLFQHYYKLVKKGGQLGIVAPGLAKEFENGLPNKMKPYWETDMYAFHSAEWWKNLWEKTDLVKVQLAENIEDSRELWLKSNCDNELLVADEKEILTFVMMLAKRK